MRFDSIFSGNPTIRKGHSLLLLGTAVDGPVLQPVEITSFAQAEKMFGQAGTLLRGIEQSIATDNGIQLFAMRVNGEVSRMTLWGKEMGGEIQAYLVLESLYGGDKYNGIDIRFDSNDDGESELCVSSNRDDLVFDTIHYTLSAYDTTDALVKQINLDASEGRLPFRAYNKQAGKPSVNMIGYIDEDDIFSGGEDDDVLSKNEYYLRLEEAYSILEGRYIDYILPLGAYYDDTYPLAFYDKDEYGLAVYIEDRDYLTLRDTQNADAYVSFGKQLVEFCKKQMGNGIMTHGFIGFHPLHDITHLETYSMDYIVRLVLTAGLALRYGLAEIGEADMNDFGYYVSLVAGEMKYPDGADGYFDNMAVTYATMVTNLPYDQTTTNLPIPNAGELRYEFTSEEIAELGRLGVVVPRTSPRNGTVIAGGVTGALTGSDMHDIANVRQVQLTLAFLNEALDEFIGQPIDAVIRNNSMDITAKNVLENLKDSGLLIDYNYFISYDENRGIGAVTVDLLTKNSIQFIRANAGISSAPLG